jgi:Domain of unknown function (DUF4166)
MSDTEVLHDGRFADDRSPGRRCPASRQPGSPPNSLQDLLGQDAWALLPQAVQARFADSAPAVDYVGEFEIVRASALGRVIAWACQIIGTPVVPRTGRNVSATVHVAPSGRGTEWLREYRWPGCAPCLVRSTKVLGVDGVLVEELPACLRMELDVYEQGGALHFVSRAYYFEVTIPGTLHRVRVTLPIWLSPGITHVEHIDGVEGWFRFTMTVTHPFFGETFYQTGQFHCAGG